MSGTRLNKRQAKSGHLRDEGNHQSVTCPKRVEKDYHFNQDATSPVGNETHAQVRPGYTADAQIRSEKPERRADKSEDTRADRRAQAFGPA